MANLATQTDVETSLLRALTANEITYVQALLARASRAVRSYTGQYLEEVEHDAITIEPDLYGNLRLPQIPVTTIESVTVDGVLVDAADYEWDVHGHITRPTFNSWEINGTVSPWGSPVDVVYTHGYDPIPDDVVEIVADIVAGRISGASASSAGGTVKRAQVDDVQVEYDTAASAMLGSEGLDDTQKLALDRYKQPARPVNMLSLRVPWP